LSFSLSKKIPLCFKFRGVNKKPLPSADILAIAEKIH